MLSCWIRYEGIFIYTCYVLFKLIKSFSYKRLFYYFSLVLFNFALLELYFQFYDHSYISGVYTNPLESNLIDFERGIRSLMDINLILIEYFWNNLGFFILGGGIVILKLKSLLFKNEYNFVALSLLFFWFFLSQARLVSVQERYWIIVFLLLIPLLTSEILKLKYGKQIFFFFLLSIVSIEKYYVGSKPTSEYKQIVSRILDFDCRKGALC